MLGALVKWSVIDGKLVFTDRLGRKIESHRLPLVVGGKYHVMQPYRDIDGGKYGQKDYAWRDKRAVPIGELDKMFEVTDMKYVNVENVTDYDWVASGVNRRRDGGYDAGGEYVSDTPIGVGKDMIVYEFGYSPRWVYVFHVRMIAKK
jgi:hypothetical protein